MNLPWQQVDPIDGRLFSEVRRAAIFECCKWDPQVEDVCTLSPLPVVLKPSAWRELVSLSEQLAREVITAEQEILQKAHLLKQLGLPWRLRRRLAAPEVASGQGRHSRLIRFDFHFTTEGWRISEANTDVPGGFNEASGFTRLMARHYPQTLVSGDPVERMAQGVGQAIGKAGTVALVHATAFTDDRQVMVYLARRLESAGHKTMLIAPDHFRWSNRKAVLETEWAKGPVDFVYRFFPAEWLPALPRRSQWWHLLGGSETPLCNPGSSLISQSKRFPLVWNELPFRLPAWEALLPRTWAVKEAAKRGLATESLVFKPAFGRVGDMIKMHGLTPEKDLKKIDRFIRRYPKMWVAQERFEAVPMVTPQGPVYPCIGMYTLDAKVIGAYGRCSRQPLINHLAQDAAVLIEDTADLSHPSENTENEPLSTLQTVGA